MHIAKRHTLAMLAGILLTFGTGASAQDEASRVAAPGISLQFFPASGVAPRASALLLHGYRCIEDCMPAFTRYAQALNAQGIDAYFVSYYDDSDRQALAAGTLDQGPAYAVRFKAWTGKVHSLLQQVKSHARSNGKLALIGFSQGGRLAIAGAANNPDVQALVAIYARLPRANELNAEITALPPTLLLHGSEDTVVPLSYGEAVHDKARSLGAARGMVVYPGEGHGFDFSESSAAALDARKRVVGFVHGQLQ